MIGHLRLCDRAAYAVLPDGEVQGCISAKYPLRLHNRNDQQELFHGWGVIITGH